MVVLYISYGLKKNCYVYLYYIFAGAPGGAIAGGVIGGIILRVFVLHFCRCSRRRHSWGCHWWNYTNCFNSTGCLLSIQVITLQFFVFIWLYFNPPSVDEIIEPWHMISNNVAF